MSDSQISPDAGSTNPFTNPMAGGPEKYTVTVGAGSSGSANVLPVHGSRLVFIVFRVIAPDQGFDRTGGVGLPSVSLVAQDGSVRNLAACPFASAESSLGTMIPLLIGAGFTTGANLLNNFLAAAQHGTPSGGCTASQSGGSAAVAFGPAPGESFFPNPVTTYLQTPNVCFQAGKVLVIRGEAFVYPDTYYGRSVFHPAFDGQIQARYWSMCNNYGVVPYPAVACDADYETALDPEGAYTYVVSNDPAPPSWLPADASWLPWGATTIPITLLFRTILPGQAPVPSAYYPQGVICDEALVMSQGWQACFSAAGLR